MTEGSSPSEALVERSLQLLRRGGDSERKREAMRAQLVRLQRRLLLRDARVRQPGAAPDPLDPSAGGGDENQ